ncbi:MAG TPA: acetyl-CoA carboxylase, carboxyltransferase subunit beta [Sphaerochaetaceae bacterium]|nr:acetyl-CoA carboxylase, carboxyltransferase subunit beta [Sphaerochaetaceae bacterium]
MPKNESCPACHRVIAHDVLEKYLMVCPECGFHHRLNAPERIVQITDPNSFIEFSGELCSRNPIELDGYTEKLLQCRKKASMNEAVVTGTCNIENQEAVLAVMSFDFMGGSMGSVVGEKITQAMFEGALTRTPVIIFTASGGARMQEGIFSLMQMAKTASAAALLEKTGVPLFIVLTHPTTGGVTASFAMLGDVIIAEPGALIGFAGPRVIEGTIGQTLPEGFQRAEFQLKKGFVDAIVPRDRLRSQLAFLMRTHKEQQYAEN